MINTCSSDIFEYDKKNKTILFFNERDYNWSKIILQALIHELYLDNKLLNQIQLVCLDKNFTLTLNGLAEPDEPKILEILEKNGLKQQHSINQWAFKWETFTHFCKTYTPRFLFHQHEHKTDKKSNPSSEEIPLLQKQDKDNSLLSELEVRHGALAKCEF